MASEGRGRLSSIDMLPDIADEDISWVCAQLLKGKMAQKDILLQFNARLADKGIGSISVGTFSRYSMAKAKAARELGFEMRLVAESGGFSNGDVHDLTEYAMQNAQARMSRMVREDNLDPKGLRAVISAFNIAIKTRQMSKEYSAKAQKEIDAAKAQMIEKVAQIKGLSDEAAERIKAQILGVEPKISKAPEPEPAGSP